MAEFTNLLFMVGCEDHFLCVRSIGFEEKENRCRHKSCRETGQKHHLPGCQNRPGSGERKTEFFYFIIASSFFAYSGIKA